MPWETTIDKHQGKTLRQIADEMKAAKIEPIILQWVKPLLTMQNVYGFDGCRTWSGENLNGSIEMSGVIDSNRSVIIFHPDNFRIGYAVVARCKRNMDILAATSMEKNLPWVIVDEGIRAEVAAMAGELTKEAPKEAPPKDKKKNTIAELVAVD